MHVKNEIHRQTERHLYLYLHNSTSSIIIMIMFKKRLELVQINHTTKATYGVCVGAIINPVDIIGQA